MVSVASSILDHLSALSDPTRSRLLLLLDRHELTVSELCGVLQLPQSTVSRHLKALADAGWIGCARRGPAISTRCLATTSTPPRGDCGCSCANKWGQRPRPHRTSGGCRRPWPRGARRRRSSSLRRPANGIGCATSCSATASSRGTGGAAEPDWVVGDLGCGTGQVSEALAPFVASVIAVDASAEMLQAAKKRLQAFDNVELRRGDLEALPIDDGRLDAATLMLVLHHVTEPARALAEAARVLKPGGR